MKKILFSVLAIAAFAACSTEEQIAAPKGEAIAFGNAFVDNSVRADAATDPSHTTSNLTKFNVYGAVNRVNIFDGDEVSGTVGADVWNFTDTTTLKQYWIPGAPYKFVAVVDGNKTGATVTNTNTTTGLPETITYTVDGKTDLLCEVVNINSAAADQGVVGFTFSHLLSKVKFSVKNKTNAQATNYRIAITEAKITNAYEAGVYDVNKDAWTPGTLGSFTLQNLIIPSNKTEYNESEILLIPTTAASTVADDDADVKVGLYIKANIEATSNGTDWTPVSAVEKTFANVIALDTAHAYHFIVELGIGNEIKFTATALTDWADGDGANDTTLN